MSLRCEQNNNFKIGWSHLPRSSPRGSGPSEYLDLSSDAGFNQTTFEQSGRQVNILVKMNVKVNDSGSYRCEVLSGRDTSYAMDVYVINSKYPDFYTLFLLLLLTIIVTLIIILIIINITLTVTTTLTMMMIKTLDTGDDNIMDYYLCSTVEWLASFFT